jgi:hypothetical protein
MQKKTNAQIWVLSILLLTMTVLHITKKMRKGLNNTIIAKTNSGEKVVYKLNELDSYRINGKEFQRKYVVHQGFEKS